MKGKKEIIEEFTRASGKSFSEDSLEQNEARQEQLQILLNVLLDIRDLLHPNPNGIQ